MVTAVKAHGGCGTHESSHGLSPKAAPTVFNNLIHPTAGAVVRGGKTIAIADVYESCASAALFTIVFTGITALIRLYSRQPAPR
jgi:putative membrane protein